MSEQRLYDRVTCLVVRHVVRAGVRKAGAGGHLPKGNDVGREKH